MKDKILQAVGESFEQVVKRYRWLSRPFSLSKDILKLFFL
jgi:hypothetical protein